VSRAGDGLRKHQQGIALLSADQYEEELSLVAGFRAQHAEPLTRVASGLRYYVRDEAADGAWDVGQRLKAMPTLLDKLIREPRMELARMHDIGGCRGILPNQHGVDRVIERLMTQRRWTLRDHVWDYVAKPKQDGYRAKHLVAIKDGLLIEVQLRTRVQHRWAELVERFDRSHRLNLKAGRAIPEMQETFAEISEILRLQEYDEISEVELLRRIAEVSLSIMSSAKIS